MNRIRNLARLGGLVLLLAPAAIAQDKTEPIKPVPTRSLVPVRVQVVFGEYDGEKKVSSLPYTLNINAEEGPQGARSLRMKLRVPITTGGGFQYMDVGTDVDCRVRVLPDNRYELNLTLARSAIYSPGSEKRPIDLTPGEQPLAAQPIIREFRGTFDLILRDAQTMQSVLATDPVSGRVVKVDVTLNVVK